MSLTAHQLRLFSRSVLALSELTQTTDPDTWLSRAVSELKALVPFDSAWWGQVEAGQPGGSAKNVMHGSLGLSPQFAEEWNTIARCDHFARASMEKLGQPVIYNGSDDNLINEPAALVEFSQRHGLYHCLAITLKFPSSGLLFFVSIYRDKPQPKFKRMDADWLEAFSAHVLSGWERSLRQANHGSLQGHWDSLALANSNGRVLYIGKALSRVLDECFDNWRGTYLPDPLLPMLATRARLPHKGQGARLMVEPCGRWSSVKISSKEDLRLSPREWSVAHLYAQGMSYKEVARCLGVTPATVRTYLRQVYGQLGVSNKVGLANALRPRGVVSC
ncbi:LuxR family transcriptional regulator [Natronospirillum operosum]|uniref:LuxR family transcriptional regulator n=1 Tax=Natronospirillum operosum TaxID=2759953 RepID=A0A4Z0WGF9_9GAMM|nr:helix-turn-helix transcriptional regulator [Natronospirillum operosum]TGG95037.1 LuxR family transcriptional regulator [Natronospirillum operosum]